MEAAGQALHSAERAGMSAAEQTAADASIDLDADENSCPACMDPIPKGSRSCPSCGLRLG
ncbi:MAG: putative amidophosphoribosyltransferase [Planctomycetota bacterium]